MIEQVHDHQGNVGRGSTPILVLDAWEHAFYLQYENQKVDFVEVMWAVVNWQGVAKRYAAAKERGDSLLLAPWPDGRRLPPRSRTPRPAASG